MQRKVSRATIPRLARPASVLALLAVAAGPGLILGLGSARALSRLMTYGSEAECAAGHVLPAALCRSAFANARAEFESKTRAFPTLALCAKAYGACAPSRPAEGARGATLYRPAFNGVEIVDTPREKTVIPILAGQNRAISFAPRSLTAPVPVRAAPPARQAAFRPGLPHAFRPPDVEAPVPPSAPPPPGSGFTLKNGVLTYPAPARFAPQNLPRQP